MRSYDGCSTITRSPGSIMYRKSSAAASIEPLVTITWLGSIPCSSVAIHSQRSGWPIPVP